MRRRGAARLLREIKREEAEERQAAHVPGSPSKYFLTLYPEYTEERYRAEYEEAERAEGINGFKKES